MLLDLVTDIDSPSGYSAFARAFGKALFDAGVDIKVTPHKHDKTTIPLDEFWTDKIAGMVNRQDRPDIRMHIETPEFFRPVPGIKNIGFTFWETDKIPGAVKEGEPGVAPNFNWVNQMNMMDEMWTSANFAAKAFTDSGVTVPTRVVGIPLEFLDSDEELPISGVVIDEGGALIHHNERRIVIGTVAQFNFRKNLEDLIIAVCSEFRSHEVVLVLKTYGATQNDPRQEDIVKKRVMSLKNTVGWKDIPQVITIQNTLSDLQMRQLYNSMDMFVTCSRGEGFCIPAAQAMGSGVPTITTDWSAMTDFVHGGPVHDTGHPQTGWPVNYQLEPVYGMPFIPWYRPDQRWARIDMVHLMETMRTIYTGVKEDNYDLATIAQTGAEYVREKYSPEVIGKLGREYLEAVLAK